MMCKNHDVKGSFVPDIMRLRYPVQDITCAPFEPFALITCMVLFLITPVPQYNLAHHMLQESSLMHFFITMPNQM